MITTNNAKLVSFDVIHLFSNVPTTDCKDIIVDILNSSDFDRHMINDLSRLFNVCIDQLFVLSVHVHIKLKYEAEKKLSNTELWCHEHS